jgi:hypothetical protein
VGQEAEVTASTGHSRSGGWLRHLRRREVPTTECCCSAICLLKLRPALVFLPDLEQSVKHDHSDETAKRRADSEAN